MTERVITTEKCGSEVKVLEMALRREERAEQQLELLERCGADGCVVCLNMNIAGPVKRSGLADNAFLSAVRALKAAFFVQENGQESPLVSSLFINRRTGIEALFALKGDAEQIKNRCVEIEEASPAGRLFDIDVIVQGGRKLARNAPRKCLICGENAYVCARSRAHSVPELQAKTRELLGEALAEETAEFAVRALEAEVHVTPKSGLVDEINNGANPDMDIAMFERSAETLRPFFREIALSVLAAGKDALYSEELASRLREIGLAAENAMLTATGGINTHRGAIYSIGLLTAARAACVAFTGIPAEDAAEDSLFPEPAENCRLIAALLARSLGDGTYPESKGAVVRKKYGVGGAVEQAAAGFPLAEVAKRAKTEYDNNLKEKAHETLGWAVGLIAVMAQLDDNNALRRGGKDGANFVKTRAAELLEYAKTASSEELRAALTEFDTELTERNISCGGAADMLAAGIFLRRIEQEKEYACGLFKN